MRILTVLLVLTASVAMAQLNIKSKVPDVNKKVDAVSQTAGATTDADLQILTKKLKSVQNEKGPIVFKKGSSTVDIAKCEKTFQAIHDIIMAFPGFLVQVEGHTDNIGVPKKNMTLSEKRAKAVMDLLKSKYKVPANRLKSKGFGDTQPIADNSTKDGQAKNRRVDFSVFRMK